MKLSIVIICWNDWKVIEECLHSIVSGTRETEYEIVVSDNGSTDGSVEKIRAQFPLVRIVENRENLGFARGNNAGIRYAAGEYVLILNPDTVVHAGSLDRLIRFANKHAECGAFGCLVQNPDGSYQESARPFPSVRGAWIAALYLRPLGRLSSFFASDRYVGWNGDTGRTVDWQSGCCILFRGDVLKHLEGFDERFFYHYEEVDLCRRVWNAGFTIIFTPEASITHLGGQSVGRFPLRFALETNRNRYRYFYKHYGAPGVKRCRRVLLAHLAVRRLGYRLLNWSRRNHKLEDRLRTYGLVIAWNWKLDPIAFAERGIEPAVPLATK